MIALIVYFFPAIVSVWIFETLSKSTLTHRHWFCRFAWNTVLINGICFAVKKWVLNTADVVLSSFYKDMTPAIAVNYLIMAIPLAVGIAIVQVFLHRHLRVQVEDAPSAKEVSDEEPQKD